MKKKKYLELHKSLLKTGIENGLCYVHIGGCYLISDSLFYEYFFLSREERCGKGAYYASYLNSNIDARRYGPTRQNIILFMAAMNNEL